MIIQNFQTPVPALQAAIYTATKGTKFICSICFETFTDINKHIAIFSNYDHQGYEANLLDGSNTTCFCGGTIAQAHIQMCNRCDFYVRSLTY